MTNSVNSDQTQYFVVCGSTVFAQACLFEHFWYLQHATRKRPPFPVSLSWSTHRYWNIRVIQTGYKKLILQITIMEYPNQAV